MRFLADRDRRGLGLADLIVGLAALIPVLMILAGSFPVAHLVGRRAWTLGTAQQLASAQVESMRAQSLDSLPARSTQTQTQRGQDFVLTSQVEATPTPNLKKVTVLVQWHLHQDESFQLVTYLTQLAH